MKNSKKLILPIIAIGSMLLTGCDNHEQVKETIRPPVPDSKYHGDTANGIYNFTEDSIEEQTNKLAVLEEYALKHNLAGIPIMDNQKLTHFSPRVNLPTNKYITNFGFGIIKANVDPNKNMYGGKAVEGTHPTYIRDFSTVDSGSLNAWDSQDSDVSGRTSMIQAGFFDQVMSKDKKSAKWVPSLCKTVEPIMLKKLDDGTFEEVKDHEDTAVSKYWRLKVRVGKEENATYRTAKNSKHKEKYDGRGIELEDYITPYKTMLDNNFKRAGEILSDDSGFEGLNEYIQSKDKSYENWEKLAGIKANKEEQSIDFSFISPKNAFLARYKLASGSLYGPIPAEFLKDIGGAKNFGKLDNTDKVKDGAYRFSNVICTGTFIPEDYENDKEFILKRNDTYFDNFIDVTDEKGNITKITNEKKATEEWATTLEGWKETIIKDTKEAYRQFLNGELDICEIPTEYNKDHGNDANVFKTPGSTVLSLNMNTCNEKQWEYYFGEGGVIRRHDSKNYYGLKPIMSDKDFINGVRFGINREEIAASNFRKPFCTYLSDSYTLDPTGTKMYRDTEQGIKVHEELSGGDHCGYNPSRTSALFKRAIDNGIANGSIAKNQTITLDAYFMYKRNVDNYGKLIKQQIEKQFNDQGKEHGVKLNFNVKSVDTPMDVYNKHIDVGFFDFAEGAVTGAANNPLGFMKNVSSTLEVSNGFCMNWGEHTFNVADTDPLMYEDNNGKKVAWSYDAFWQATTAKSVVINGRSIDYATDVRLEPISKVPTPKVNKVGMSFRIPKVQDKNGKNIIDYKIKSIEVAFGKFENSKYIDIKPEDLGKKYGLYIDNSTQVGYIWFDKDFLQAFVADLNKSYDGEQKYEESLIAIEAITDCGFEMNGLSDKESKSISGYTTIKKIGL